MDLENKKFYGSTTVGEKGQVVLPAQLRRDLDMQTGEKLAVLVIGKWGISWIVMVKSKVLTSIIEKILGGKLEDVLETESSSKTDKE